MDTETGLLVGIWGTLGGRIVWDWLKGSRENGFNSEIKARVEKMQDDLKEVNARLGYGIKVAERNTAHYEEFVKSLTMLNTLAAQTSEILKNIVVSNQQIKELLLQMNGLTRK